MSWHWLPCITMLHLRPLGAESVCEGREITGRGPRTSTTRGRARVPLPQHAWADAPNPSNPRTFVDLADLLTTGKMGAGKGEQAQLGCSHALQLILMLQLQGFPLISWHWPPPSLLAFSALATPSSGRLRTIPSGQSACTMPPAFHRHSSPLLQDQRHHRGHRSRC